MTVEIRFLEPAEVASHLDALGDLLRECVEQGASVGFLPPLAPAEARAYWEDVGRRVSASHALALAWVEGRVVGTAQLVEVVGKSNAPHRAEVCKLLVHPSSRRRGLGAALMGAVEERARRRGRTTLVLDTREGDASERLYQSLGWRRGGAIPEYFLNPDGSPGTTVVYYKLLRGAG